MIGLLTSNIKRINENRMVVENYYGREMMLNIYGEIVKIIIYNVYNDETYKYKYIL